MDQYNELGKRKLMLEAFKSSFSSKKAIDNKQS